MMVLKILLLWLLAYCYSSKAEDCSTDTIGLCTPLVTDIITEEKVIEEETDSTGIYITETITKTTTTTTVTNEDSGDILDGSNGYVATSKEGDMDYDWGGIGSASMPSGSYCNELGTDKCAEITDANLTTFYQQVDISELDINYGGTTQYTIKVDKQDEQDSVYMKVVGRNGTTEVFNGTDVLSASGVNSGYQQYQGNFDFSGKITNLIIEVGGRDINLAVGVLFDDVSINVLYNVIETIISQEITKLETFIALNLDQPEMIDVAEDVFKFNDVSKQDDFMMFEPIEPEPMEISYEAIEAELEAPVIEEIKIEEALVEEIIEVEMEEVVEEIVEEPVEEIEVASVDEPVDEPVEETKEEPKEEVKETKQEKANKIVKKMGDKGKYDANNQTKTLVVMQVLADSKSFFEQPQLPQIQGFFDNRTLPDGEIIDNNILMYNLFMNNDLGHNELVDLQWK
nr:putative carbohydrate binding domain containing protein [uncultured Mediterranean phage uvMED]